jgi:hypothetical protein
MARRGEDGVGLRSVEQRLARHYGAHASLGIRTRQGLGTAVELWIPLSATPAANEWSDHAPTAAPPRGDAADAPDVPDVPRDAAHHVTVI